MAGQERKEGMSGEHINRSYALTRKDHIVATYEYKTITLEQKGMGLLTSRKVPDLENVLNREGRDGWRLREVILPSGALGESDRVIVIFEREQS